MDLRPSNCSFHFHSKLSPPISSHAARVSKNMVVLQYYPERIAASDVELGDKIIDLLYSYSPAGKSVRRMEFERLVRSCVSRRESLHLVLPAFPFKSANRTDKVLGDLPDIGEEMALALLNRICTDINNIYPGSYTTVTIVSDGLVYNDILGISDEDVWNYGSALRQISKEKYPCINFARLSSLIDTDLPEPETKEEYISNANRYREEIASLGPDQDPIGGAHLEQQNVLMTYRGYIKFLATDLKYDESRRNLSNSQIKKKNQIVAKKMIQRGTAYSLAVKNAFPSSIRLSIHQSQSQYKLPISLLLGENNYTTPWHCACALKPDGTWQFAHRKIFQEDPRYQLIYRNERPSFYYMTGN
ncbi:BgTH12-00824 [Blumeria graminis f. sp. triticale]|uniref:BgTH12-00824 n=1 Tax=Blumeria graminis f. sp. triticale TaxID=1689686 RepID=A0A9W4D708_BLUGR|nr:BgTH12-00824 [Blumeria graminis f. sp. triticale]